MTIIDRYLLRQFVTTFVICFVSLTGLFIVIDAFGNLEEFMDHAKKHGGSLLAIIGKYYAYHSLPFFEGMSGMMALISAMFTITWIQRNNELTAIEAAGIPKRRVIKPVIIAAVFVSLLAVANREFFIPSCRSELIHNAQDLGGESAKPLQARYDYLTGIFFHRGETFGDQQRIHKPEFRGLPQASDLDTQTVTAENAYYYPADGDRPAGYLLTHVDQPRNIDELASVYQGKKPVLLTSADTRWLRKGEAFLVSGISFEQLEAGAEWRKLASTSELIQSLKNPSLDYGADAKVAVHARIVQPLLDITLLFLGLPLVLTWGNRNMFAAIGVCLGVVVAFMLVNLGAQQLGAGTLLTPSQAAWAPLFLFVPVAVGLADPLRA